MENSQQAREGLDFIVERPEYVKKLAAALDATGPGAISIKKQMFELLAALCAHCEDGRARVLETLEHHKKLKNERHRLTFIVQEIDRATLVDYQTSLVAFINCLIISTPRLIDRIRLRNEFIACHLLPVLNNLRKYAEAEPELAVQLDVFDEQRESDDHQCLEGPHGVDLNSPIDVFYAILSQVSETPQETYFMSILQHLLRIDPKEPISDVIWETAEKLVHRASLLDKREDAPKILRTPSTSRLFAQCQSCLHRTEPSASGSRRTSLTITNPLSPTRQTTPPPPPIAPSLPPPPPPPPNIPAPPPPMAPLAPPPPMSFSANGKRSLNKTNSGGSSDSEGLEQKLPQQEIPAPKIKMKTINWNKIPHNKVIGKNNIWTQVAGRHQKSPLADLDWSEMEGLFCQSAPSVQSSPRLGNRDGEEGRKLRQDNQEITLLDGKRSLNVNIFLKQFRSSNENIIHLIRDGLHDEIGTEKLKGLLKMLPEVDELDMLKSFKGDFNKLGNAEKFLIQLTDLSNYKLRIESMLLKEEFASNMNYLEPSISSMIAAAQDLMTNKPLQEVLYMVLCAGNFLNAGGYAGDAAGVKLTSLQKITDIRANKPNMNLIHFVALQAEKRDRNLLSFTDNITTLEDAAKMTVEQLLNEITTLEVRLQKIKRQIELSTTEPEIREQMHDFLLMAENEVSNLQLQLNNLECVRRKLADFFCEDPGSFKIEECFKIFHGFYTKFKQAAMENERRRIQEEQANARRKQREELLATRRKQMESLAQPESDGFIEMQIYDAKACQSNRKVFKNQVKNGSEDEMSVTSSPSFSRRRLGSFNGNNADSSSKEDRSPDITPNGSLRRRRSRVLSEEDEGNLMDFLKASGTDTNRDRKSWGSLDRSWARKARGSGPRKRPALLTADFANDRERPSSPSPLTENKPIVSSAPEDTPEISSKPKEWAQKIESWLRTSDADNLNEEQQKRQGRKIIGNKKSLEDTESERSNTLDTLPEGKQVYSGSQSSYRKVNPITWKPSSTLDNTDIMSAMETVEEVQPPVVKDKSAWRKSASGSTSTSEAALPGISKTNIEDPTDRKQFISSLGDRAASDRLTLYFRRPSEPKEGIDVISPTPPRMSTFGYTPSRSRDSPPSMDLPSTNKTEIDQDNIETPPATRKMFVPTPVDKREPTPPTPCKRHGRPNGFNGSNGSKDMDDNDAGDGQFDRFSAARRTRRYKRPTDSTDTPSPTDYRSPPQSQSVSKSSSFDLGKSNQPFKLNNELLSPSIGNEDISFKMPQRNKEIEQREFEPVNRIDTNSRIDKRARNRTVDVGMDEFKLARQLSQHNNLEGLPKDFISPESIKVEFEPISRHKHREPDKDEGFEETQSLCLSESPSQKTSSDGAAYESEAFESIPIQPDNNSERYDNHRDPLNKLGSARESTTPRKSLLNASNGSAISNRGSLARRSFVGNYNNDKTNKNNVQTTISSRNNNGAIDSSRTTKTSNTSLPKRSESMKSNSLASYSKPNISSIQKSNSRNSILSSRSSLNSNTSVNTVKHVPVKITSTNSAQLSKTKIVQRTPSTKKLLTTNPPVVKPPTVKRSISVTSTGSNSATRASSGRSSMSFMKPTAASATKVNPPGSKPTPIYRGRW